jgi:hypothetical protein
LNTEVQKPKNVGATLARFWHYFRPYWGGVALALTFIIIGALSQVLSPRCLARRSTATCCRDRRLAGTPRSHRICR